VPGEYDEGGFDDKIRSVSVAINFLKVHWVFNLFEQFLLPYTLALSPDPSNLACKWLQVADKALVDRNYAFSFAIFQAFHKYVIDRFQHNAIKEHFQKLKDIFFANQMKEYKATIIKTYDDFVSIHPIQIEFTKPLTMFSEVPTIDENNYFNFSRAVILAFEKMMIKRYIDININIKPNKDVNSVLNYLELLIHGMSDNHYFLQRLALASKENANAKFMKEELLKMVTSFG
jgi:hypothetical protein